VVPDSIPQVPIFVGDPHRGAVRQRVL